jgi:YfiH family protein
MPVLFCDRDGTAVAAAHAGWRGLSGGVLENTLGALPCPRERTMAFLGPAIGPGAFEVGEDVLEAFTRLDSGAAACFQRKPADPAGASPKWLADLYALACRRLAAAGVYQVFGGGCCTYSDRARFFSHRRDRQTGRQAALIWLDG